MMKDLFCSGYQYAAVLNRILNPKVGAIKTDSFRLLGRPGQRALNSPSLLRASRKSVARLTLVTAVGFLVWRSASSAVHGISVTVPTFTNGRGSDHDGPIRHANLGRHTHTEVLHRPVVMHRRDILRPLLAVALRRHCAEPRKSRERRGATPQQPQGAHFGIRSLELRYSGVAPANLQRKQVWQELVRRLNPRSLYACTFFLVFCLSPCSEKTREPDVRSMNACSGGQTMCGRNLTDDVRCWPLVRHC